ncbi:MAG: class I SAM-dependent methyltransferase [Bacteroidia bacterium]
MNNDLVAYYAERAKEYEKIYEKPERQSDLSAASELLQNIFLNKNLIELACGTGYWTQRIAKCAGNVIATDINAPVIEIAKTKVYEKNNVDFSIADIFNYSLEQPHDNLFAGFIWSHIKLQELGSFIDALHCFVKPGGLVAFIDNNYVEGSSLPVVCTDEHGNKYQERELENGKKYSIVKNFPSNALFKQVLEGKGENIKFFSLKYYWLVWYNRK